MSQNTPKYDRLTSSNWDNAYAAGKYQNDEPIKLLNEIIPLLMSWGGAHLFGYYPGCGNGRNYIPLVRAGLNIFGTDISKMAIAQLRKILPSAHVAVRDFLAIEHKQYDYLLSLQLFQHVDENGPTPLFEKAHHVLRPGGLLILRVNVTSTQISNKHTRVSVNRHGGFTIRYTTGEKSGQLFFVKYSKYRLCCFAEPITCRHVDLSLWPRKKDYHW